MTDFFFFFFFVFISLIYLEEPTEGGATIFNKLGISVKPTRKSGLFWHNCHQNETFDSRTLHAACPVLSGSKMVTNKWFRFRGQFSTRKCSPERDASYTMSDISQ